VVYNARVKQLVGARVCDEQQPLYGVICSVPGLWC
jgi:hypothetical protein